MRVVVPVCFPAILEIAAYYFVSAMATVYSVGSIDEAEGIRRLSERLQQQVRPDGAPLYTALTGLTLMVFYVFALQCVSTIAIVRRETNGWKWPMVECSRPG